MSGPSPEMPAVGMKLPALLFEPISRTELALFAGASHDHTPIHIDIDFVRRAGGDDVFAQGMLVMARMAQVVTRWRPQRHLVSLSGRFLDIVHVGDKLTVMAEIVEVVSHPSGAQVLLDLSVDAGHGRRVMTGQARVTL